MRSFILGIVASLALSACTIDSLSTKADIDPNRPSWVVTFIDGKKQLTGHSLNVTPDNGVAIVGTGFDVDFVLKRSQSGQIEWYKEAENALSGIYASHLSSLGNLIVAGDYPNAENELQEAYVMSIDSNGKINWQNQYHGFDDTTIFAVTETADRGLVFGGAVYPTSAAENFDAEGNGLIMKTTALGSVEWMHRAAFADDDRVVDLLILPDQTIFALVNNNDQNQASHGVRLLHLDQKGAVLHSYILPKDKITQAVKMHLNLMQDKVWIAGELSEEITDENEDLHSQNQDDVDGRIALLEVDFQAKPHRHFVDNQSKNSDARDFIILDDGSIAVVGIAQQQDTVDELQALYAHFDKDGTIAEMKHFGADGVDFAEDIALLKDGSILILANFNANDDPQLVLISRARL